MLVFLHVWVCFLRCSRSWSSVPCQAFLRPCSSITQSSNSPRFWMPQSFVGWCVARFAFHSWSDQQKGHPPDERLPINFYFAVICPSSGVALLTLFSSLQFSFCSSGLASSVPLPVTFIRYCRILLKFVLLGVEIIFLLGSSPDIQTVGHYSTSCIPTKTQLHLSRAESLNWFISSYVLELWDLPINYILFIYIYIYT